MTIFCHLRAFIFGECWCQFCVYGRRLDQLIEDWNREQAAKPSQANCHKDGGYR